MMQVTAQIGRAEMVASGLAAEKMRLEMESDRRKRSIEDARAALAFMREAGLPARQIRRAVEMYVEQMTVLGILVDAGKIIDVDSSSKPDKKEDKKDG